MAPRKKPVAEQSYSEQRAEYIELLHWYTEEIDKHVLANERASDQRAAVAARSHVRKTFPQKFGRIVELEKAGQGMRL